MTMKILLNSIFRLTDSYFHPGIMRILGRPFENLRSVHRTIGQSVLLILFFFLTVIYNYLWEQIYEPSMDPFGPIIPMLLRSALILRRQDNH